MLFERYLTPPCPNTLLGYDLLHTYFSGKLLRIQRCHHICVLSDCLDRLQAISDFQKLACPSALPFSSETADSFVIRFLVSVRNNQIHQLFFLSF